MNGGFTGTILRVNLTTGNVTTEKIPTRDVEMYIGGRGLGAAMMYRELKPGIDPLGPENKLFFMTGPITGTTAPGSSKYVVLTKSPLTNIFLMSISSRDFGNQLRKSGYDALVVEGRSEKPVYLYIADNRVEIRDAGKLWGMRTDQADWYLRQEELRDQGFKVACIGPAGENRVPYACIISEWRAAGRGGAGAVMGSKNLKAVAVKGSGRIPLFDQVAYAGLVKEIYRELDGSPRTLSFRRDGTLAQIESLNSQGIFPAMNFKRSYWQGSSGLSSETMNEKYIIKSVYCAPCMSHCGKLTIAREGPYAGTITEGPEYETLYSFGSCCGVSDFDAVIYADTLCDQYGLDSMSAGVSLAFAMECFEKGIISAKDTDGLVLNFGNHGVFGEIIRKMAYREGFGGVLALGTRRMSEIFGRGSEDFAMQVKGMELGGYDPRGLKGMALVYACGSRGGCHHAGGRTLPAELDTGKYDRFADAGKAQLVKNSRDIRIANDSMVMCGFCSPGNQLGARMLTAATGIEYSVSDFMKIGDRVSNVERAFNTREGLRRADDTLPRRLLEEKVEGGPSTPVKLDLMLDEFYNACGWDPKTGIPMEEKLRQLNLDEIADDIYANRGVKEA